MNIDRIQPYKYNTNFCAGLVITGDDNGITDRQKNQWKNTASEIGNPDDRILIDLGKEKVNEFYNPHLFTQRDYFYSRVFTVITDINNKVNSYTNFAYKDLNANDEFCPPDATPENRLNKTISAVSKVLDNLKKLHNKD